MMLGQQSALPRVQVWVADLVLNTLNRTLALDPEARQKLAPLVGKTLSLSLEGVASVWCWQITAEGFAWHEADEVDIALSGNVGGYVSLLRGQERHADDRLRMMGDVHDAQALQSALRQLQPDWEAACVARLGATGGQACYQALRRLHVQGQSAWETVAQAVETWQQRYWVSAQEYAQFSAQVREMLQRLAKLEG